MDSVDLIHDGKTVSLRFSWRTIAALREAWGEGYADRVPAAIDRRELPGMADLIAQAAGMTAAEVLDWSPPIIKAVTALQRAWTLAWLGPEALRVVDDERQDSPGPPTAQSILSALRSKLRFGRESVGPNSGTMHRGSPA
jgi:hypothetical protein